MSALDLKLCKKCGVAKQKRAFSAFDKAPDGLQHHCKACARVYAVAYRAANRERIAALNAKHNAQRVIERAEMAAHKSGLK